VWERIFLFDRTGCYAEMHEMWDALRWGGVMSGKGDKRRPKDKRYCSEQQYIENYDLITWDYKTEKKEGVDDEDTDNG
jgi:hypothetical protein